MFVWMSPRAYSFCAVAHGPMPASEVIPDAIIGCEIIGHDARGRSTNSRIAPFRVLPLTSRRSRDVESCHGAQLPQIPESFSFRARAHNARHGGAFHPQRFHRIRPSPVSFGVVRDREPSQTGCGS